MPLSTYEGENLIHSGTVTSIKRVEETQTMYNLTVDTAHTFFVGEGEWLVHNTGACSINVGHIFHGEINRRGRAVGFHHEGSIGHEGFARVVGRGTEDVHGVYNAVVEVLDPVSNQWVRKKVPNHTMFPRDWSRSQVLEEIRGAFSNATFNGNSWTGTSPSNVPIGGFLDHNGNINTAFPIYTP